MDWTQLLTDEIEEVYGATAGLMRRVDYASLDWKPESGSHGMSLGQLLDHCGETLVYGALKRRRYCGQRVCARFVTGIHAHRLDPART